MTEVRNTASDRDNTLRRDRALRQTPAQEDSHLNETAHVYTAGSDPRQHPSSNSADNTRDAPSALKLTTLDSLPLSAVGASQSRHNASMDDTDGSALGSANFLDGSLAWSSHETGKTLPAPHHASGLPAMYGSTLSSNSESFSLVSSRRTPMTPASHAMAASYNHPSPKLACADTVDGISAYAFSPVTDRHGPDRPQRRSPAGSPASLKKRSFKYDDSEEEGDGEHFDLPDSNVIAGARKTGKIRATQACDKCREQKCKCIPDPDHPGTCAQCLLLGEACTFRGPSMKRGPPKGYLAAVINRLETMEDTILAKLAEHSHDQRARDLLRELVGDTALRQALSGRLRFSQHRDKLPRLKKGAGPHGITWQDSWWVSMPGVPSRPTTGIPGSKGLSHRFAMDMSHPRHDGSRKGDPRQPADPDSDHGDAWYGLSHPSALVHADVRNAGVTAVLSSQRALEDHRSRRKSDHTFADTWHIASSQERPIDDSMLEGEPQWSTSEREPQLHGTLSSLYKVSSHNLMCKQGVWSALPVREVGYTSHGDTLPTANAIEAFFQHFQTHFAPLRRSYYEEQIRNSQPRAKSPQDDDDSVTLLQQVMSALGHHDGSFRVSTTTIHRLLNSDDATLFRVVSLLLVAYSAIGQGSDLEARRCLATAIVLAHAIGIHQASSLIASSQDQTTVQDQRNQLWACCVVLDKLLASAGHPPLIDPAYCDAVPPPPVADGKNQLYLLHLYNVSVVLDDIYRNLYSSEPVKASILDSLERKLTQCYYHARADLERRKEGDTLPPDPADVQEDFGTLNLVFHQAYIQLHSRFRTLERQEAAFASALSAGSVAATLGNHRCPPWTVHALFVAGTELVKAARHSRNAVASPRLFGSLDSIKACLHRQARFWPVAKHRLAVLEGAELIPQVPRLALIPTSEDRSGGGVQSWTRTTVDLEPPPRIGTLAPPVSTGWKLSTALPTTTYAEASHSFSFEPSISLPMSSGPQVAASTVNVVVPQHHITSTFPAISGITSSMDPLATQAVSLSEQPLSLPATVSASVAEPALTTLHGFANVATSAIPHSEHGGFPLLLDIGKRSVSEAQPMTSSFFVSAPHDATSGSAATVASTTEVGAIASHSAIMACTPSGTSESGPLSWERRGTIAQPFPSHFATTGAPWFGAPISSNITAIGPLSSAHYDSGDMSSFAHANYQTVPEEDASVGKQSHPDADVHYPATFPAFRPGSTSDPYERPNATVSDVRDQQYQSSSQPTQGQSQREDDHDQSERHATHA
ncbi:unnamed protein product [Parajaminaea phylloscopi]